MVNNKPLVSVFMISYNQEKFIIEALSNVLNQKTNFEYKVYLSDDCSTDNTVKTVNDFLSNHPKKDNVIFISQPNNLGWMPNFIYTLQMCKDSGSKYIAMCEGDDFWTNENKLQKQIDLLENNTDVVLACHKYRELYNDGHTVDCPYFREDFFKGKNSFKFSQNDFMKFMRIQTMTIVFRSSALNLDLRHQYKFYCDTHIKHHILDHGLGLYTDDFDAVYRIHGNNVFMSLNSKVQSKFAYDVYVDLITNNKSNEYSNMRNLVMQDRISIELNEGKSIFSLYLQKLLFQQFLDIKSAKVFIKNQIQATKNII